MAAKGTYTIRKEVLMRMVELAGMEIVEHDSEDSFNAASAADEYGIVMVFTGHRHFCH